MENLTIVRLAAIAVVTLLTAIPGRAEACKPSDLLGHVKSVIETQSWVDSTTGKIGPGRLADRIDVSRDGGTIVMTLYDPNSAKPTSIYTAYFENGRLVRGVDTALPSGKTVPSANCSYDEQGRLVRAETGMNTREFHIVETYEYGVGFIRRRANVFGSWSVNTQTLDSAGRVVKEEWLDEARATVVETSEFTYGVDRAEQCSVSYRAYGAPASNPHRQCATTVRDSHGNEIEVRTEGETRTTSFEYDAAGNWVSKRIAGVGLGGTRETIIQRKIEYW